MVAVTLKQFRHTHPTAKRCADAERLRVKYPDRVPCIVCTDGRRTSPTLDRDKFLVPRSLTVGEFNHIIRRKTHLKSSEAFFLFTESSTILPTARTMGDVYTDHRALDGFLYIIYSVENTFGR